MSDSTQSSARTLLPALRLVALIAAGEAAFLLPFLLARVFRPTVLDVFGITNFELGGAYAAYGLIAMLAYIAGGPLADRFPARGMLLTALLLTAAGGLAMAQVPSLNVLVALYIYWGITTIALFWAPLIKATRDWGGSASQGRAFGLLDGGRGLLAAATGSLLVSVFAMLLPVDPSAATLAERTAALKQVIMLLIAITASIAVLLWFALPATHGRNPNTEHLGLDGLKRCIRLPAVWLQALIILCAYVGFRSIDDFSLYANQVLGLNEVDAAQIGVVSLWVRPVAAVGAGLLADRFGTARMSAVSFVLIAAAATYLASGLMPASSVMIYLLTISCASLGIFGLRGLYFAIMQEGRVPLAFTGSAVGLVSLMGYTPDVFMAPLMGFLIDYSPGAAGHQHVFWVVAGFAMLGLAASLAFQKLTAQSASRIGTND
jgi:nitrate/nitrite transporter NarK